MTSRTGRRVIPMVLAVLVLAALATMPAQAQDFQTLLKAVDKLEANLKKMVEQESTARQQQIAALQQKIDGLTPGAGGTIDNTAIEELQKEIIQLKLDLKNLGFESETAGIDNERWERITSDIHQLKSENMYLRTAIENSQSRMVAGDEAAYETGLAMLPAMATDESAENALAGIELSGFFDALGTWQSSEDDKTEFGFGQAEIDLESELSDRVAVAVAVAYNPDDGIFELGAAELGFNLYGADEGFLTSVDVTAGQFDVPFGVDYHVVASPDRKLVTCPLAVAYTHDDWNDYGVQFGLECGAGNWVAYVVNGFESSAEILDEVATLALGEDVYEEIDTSPANAFGTRLGGTPIDGLEFGTSFASGLNHSGESEMLLWGADMQWSMFNFEVKGEWIYHSLNRSLAESNNRGWYLQGAYDILGRAFVVSRYGSFKPDGEEWIGELSVGAGYRIYDGLELRWESLINEDSDANQNIIQAVVSF